METLTLTAPEVIPQRLTTDYRVSLLALDLEQAQIIIHVRGTNGERKQFTYDGDVAVVFITALNKSNLTIKSLQRRILERLATDGYLAGAVTGTVD
jgi:hypothetical protein